MIHGVLEKCFVPGPRGQFVGGSPISLHAGQLTRPQSHLLWITDPDRETGWFVPELREATNGGGRGKAKDW